MEQVWNRFARLAGLRPAAPVGRLADEHNWTVLSNTTARIQAFRDQSRRTFALVTRRVGDCGASHINAAKRFRDDAWAQLFAGDAAPPTLIFNLLDLDPDRRNTDPAVVQAVFTEDGRFKCCAAADPADVELLDSLGAQWDEGAGFEPYVPPEPTEVLVLCRMRVCDLPLPHNLFRDVSTYLVPDWKRAVEVALRCGAADQPSYPGVPGVIVNAARSLWEDPIMLLDDVRGELSLNNGQHRAEAMRRQGVETAIAALLRPVDAAPLMGEIRVWDFA